MCVYAGGHLCGVFICVTVCVCVCFYAIISLSSRVLQFDLKPLRVCKLIAVCMLVSICIYAASSQCFQ